MNYAIAQLQESLAVVETNASINERENNLEQAKLEREAAKSFHEAINKLKNN